MTRFTLGRTDTAALAAHRAAQKEMRDEYV